MGEVARDPLDERARLIALIERVRRWCCRRVRDNAGELGPYCSGQHDAYSACEAWLEMALDEASGEPDFSDEGDPAEVKDGDGSGSVRA